MRDKSLKVKFFVFFVTSRNMEVFNLFIGKINRGNKHYEGGGVSLFSHKGSLSKSSGSGRLKDPSGLLWGSLRR